MRRTNAIVDARRRDFRPRPAREDHVKVKTHIVVLALWFTARATTGSIVGRRLYDYAPTPAELHEERVRLVGASAALAAYIKAYPLREVVDLTELYVLYGQARRLAAAIDEIDARLAGDGMSSRQVQA
jgi:hypothetical protein